KNMTAHHNDWDTSAQRSESSSSITSSFDPKIVALKAKMAEINKNLMRVLQVNQQVKAVTLNCETCGGPHSYNDCPATIGQTQNVYAAGAYQGGNSYQPQGNRNLLSYRSDNYLGPPGLNQNQNRNNQNQNFQNQNRNHGIPQENNQGRNQFFQGASHGQNPPSAYRAPAYQARGYQAPVHQPSIPQPQVEDLKGITTRSGTAYQGLTIPTTSSSLPQVVERETEVTKDMMPPTNNGSTKDVQPPVVQTKTPIPNSEPVVAPIIEPVVALVSAPKPNHKPSIPYPPRLHDQKLRDKPNDQKENFFQIFQDLNFNISFLDALILMPKSFLKTERALIDVFKGELTLRVGKEAITFNLDQTSRYSANYNDMTTNRIDVIDVACEEYSQEVLSFSDVITSGNPTPYYDKIVSTSSLTLTPFWDSDFLLEEVDAFLALKDDATSPKVDHSYFDPERDILLLEAFLNDVPSLPHPNQGNYPPQDLPPHLEYAFLEGDDKFPVIIAKDLSDKEKTALITVLKSHKRAIAWKLSDIKEKMLKRCEDTNLCLNWENSHFMVKEGIVLGHKISKNGIEVDKAKVEIARPMTHILEKDTTFFFSKECVEAFQTLKKKLTEAPILIAPDWDLPFELMYDASDFAIENGIQNHIGNGNLVAARAEGNAAGQNANQIRCYNCKGFGHYARNCTARPRRRDAAYLQTQLLIAQKEE
nr:reverse transcriptase domain-containing protein [Tanacetum cinerariifolium]